MKILIYSDVHGNLPAFEEVLANEKFCDQYICLGDLVNYGPWSNECVELATSLPNSIILQGNHEELYLNKKLLKDECDLVKSFFSVTYPSFRMHEAIKNFRGDFKLNQWSFSHTINDMKIYEDTIIDLSFNSFIGHTHHQFIRNINNFKLINTGSLGQNRSLINKAEYVIYDTFNDNIKFKSLFYNIDILIDEMIKQSYPKNCIEYYLKKLNI